MTPDPVNITRLEKAAVDNGFDLERGSDGGWLAFGSSHASLQIWLTALGESLFLVAFSRSDVFDALANMGVAFTNPIPHGAAAARSASDPPALHRLVRRAFQLARALPDEPLKVFLDRAASLPRTTEAERLIVQRVGQEVFRDRLLDYWEGRCAITGLGVPDLLRASHVKPWADCESDAERLDVFNGLLLAPHLDAAFDRGFITVADDGTIIVADTLDPDARVLLGLNSPLRIDTLADGHRRYVPWHRRHVFRGADSR
ncbi:MAG: hypothetical protein HW381_413 [Candidatus Rokubacteria bacterium]|nr:hypothetical protein [Candidatus Rokubacteria bacterium]